MSKPKTREELLAANEAFRTSLTKEADHAQHEIISLAKKALIAGGVALSINLIHSAFFAKHKKKKGFKEINRGSSLLTKELTDIAIFELLKLASAKLSNFIEDKGGKKE